MIEHTSDNLNSFNLKAVLDAAGTMIIATDLQGTVRIFNPAAERLLGWDAREVVDRQTPSLWHDVQEVSARAAELSEKLGRTVPPGVEVFFIEARGEVSEQHAWTFIRKDGHRFPVQLVVSAIRDPSGNITGYLGTAQDLSDRVKAEQERDRFFELAQDLLCIASAEGFFLRINPAFSRVLGWSESELLSKPFLDFVHPEDRQATLDEIAKLKQGKSTLLFENRYRCQNGRWKWLSWVSTPQADGSIYATARDVTKIKRAERSLVAAKEAAEASNQAKTDFLANISHEIRTPMNAVIGMSELVLEMELGELQREYISTVLESAEGLLTLINEILDFSKIESGRMELSNSNFDLREELGKILRSLSQRADSKGLELAWHVASEVPNDLFGDVGHLRQILINLIGNAIKFTHQGEVSVRVARLESSNAEIKLRFSVQDTGIGIPVGKLKEIFKPFVQADSSTTRRYGGTGLGLSICQKLVHMMHGKLWVESEFGVGTTFYFSLSFSHGERLAEPESLGSVDLSTLSVVVLDAHPTSRQSLCENLNRWGFQSISFERGQRALEHLQQLSLTQLENSLILCDVQMLDFDGFRFVCELRKIDRLKDLAVVVLTSGSEQEELARSDDPGVQATLRKPFKPSELLDMVLTMAAREGDSARQLSSTPEDKPMPACRILLVEDGGANQKLISALLGKWGHSVVLATNGVEALDRFRSDNFDLILMDIQMPEMDGWEATCRIREMERASDSRIPIIAMTAHARDSDREKCLQMGMDGHLSKPIRRQQLIEQLSRWSTSTTPSRSGRINWQVARESNDNDEEILREVARASATELRELSIKIQESLQREDADSSRRYIHTVNSIGRTFGATDLFEISRACEAQAAKEDLQAVANKLELMNEEIESVAGELDEFLQTE